VIMELYNSVIARRQQRVHTPRSYYSSRLSVDSALFGHLDPYQICTINLCSITTNIHRETDTSKNLLEQSHLRLKRIHFMLLTCCRIAFTILQERQYRGAK
jgi:hypothetical protein